MVDEEAIVDGTFRRYGKHEEEDDGTHEARVVQRYPTGVEEARAVVKVGKVEQKSQMESGSPRVRMCVTALDNIRATLGQ